MRVAEALSRVETILNALCPPARGKDHYRTVRVAGRRELGVDVFSTRNREGHIRVHVFDVQADAVPSEAEAPQVPALSSGNCPACENIPQHYPAHYHGPRPDHGREYYGFQWHAEHEVSEDDIVRIEAAARWLLQSFRCSRGPG